MRFRTDINGLRAIAVAGVLLFHFAVKGIGGGFAGVDIFFVISGYLMTKIIVDRLEEKRFSLIDFWLERVRRIVPGLLALCCVVLLISWFFIEPMTFSDTAKNVAGSLGFISNIQYFLSAGYFAKASEETWLLHTWSLSVEWQFYMFYPLGLYALHRWTPARALPPILWACLIVSLVMSIIVSSYNPPFAFFMLPTRGWEMLAGGMLRIHANDIRKLPDQTRRLLELLGLALMLLAFCLFTPTSLWPSYNAVIPVAGAALIILSDRGEQSLLRGAVFQSIGRWSYSIYLWHWPIIVGLRYFEYERTLWVTVFAIAASVLCGYLSYRFVENPARNLAKGERPRRRTMLACLVPACVAILLSGAVVYGQGFS